jgi:hypothetical protein
LYFPFGCGTYRPARQERDNYRAKIPEIGIQITAVKGKVLKGMRKT